MRKLLSANFARMKHSRAFWAGMLFMAVFGAYMCIGSYRNCQKYDIDFTLESVLCNGFALIGVLVAVFCSMFLGTEYSDGTIRNKLVVGLDRSKIYFANYIVCSVAGILMNLTYIVVQCVIGIPLLGGFSSEFTAVLPYLAAGVVMILAFSGIFTMMGMLIQNKATSAVLCVLLVFTLLFFSSYLLSRLGEPEFYESVGVIDNVVKEERIANPNYLTETKREAYQFLMDFIPAGQSLQLSAMMSEHLWRLPVYSGVIVIVTNIAGVLVFRRKDLK